MPHRIDSIRTAVGVIGNIISGFLFASPIPTFWRICKKRTTEEFHPYPYLATMINCALWIFYGQPFIHPDSLLVVTINSAGLALETIYLIIFFIFTTKKNRVTILGFLVGEGALITAIALITTHYAHTHAKRSMVVGIICDIFGIIMYASPLSIVVKMIKTRSAEFLPVWLCLAGFLNGITWFIYAFLKKFDPYIATGNGVGAIFGATQLCFWLYFTNFGVKKDASAKGEVQLQNAAASNNLPKV